VGREVPEIFKLSDQYNVVCAELDAIGSSNGDSLM
jgi:hypothetical protein